MQPFAIFANIGSDDSTQFSNEEARNVYNTFSAVSKKTAVKNFPGLNRKSTGSGVFRGDAVMAGVRYVINGTTLFKEDSNYTRTSLGTVSGSDRAIFANDGTNLYFTANNSLYKYNGSTVSTVSQSVVTNPSSIMYINKTFIITGDNGLFATSDAGDGDTYNALNFAEAETQPDPLLRAYYFSQLIYLAGSKTIELHRYSGSGNPPTIRQDTSLVNVGIIGKHAIANTDQYLYWMGDDRKFYKCVASSYQSINSLGISHIVSRFTTVSDCVASAFVLDGQDFVLFKFPTEGAALLYSETLNYWVELSSGTNKNARASWYGESVSNCYGKNLVTDYRNGNTYELDPATYTDNGETTLHIVSGINFTGELINHVGRIITRQMFIDMQVGVGLASGQGSAPVLMCEFSQEGGEVWLSEQFVDIGVMGDYTKRVQFDQFANGYEIKARVMWSDPVPITMWSGSVDLIPGGY